MRYLLSAALLSLILLAAVVGGGGIENIILAEFSDGIDYFERLGKIDNLDIRVLSSMFKPVAEADGFVQPMRIEISEADLNYITVDEIAVPQNYEHTSHNESYDLTENKQIIISVLDYKTEEVYNVCLEEYLVGVVFSEMPASFELEALKAQAVAARSYSVYKMLHSHENDRDYHKGADICKDARHCKAYMSKEEASKKYGDIEYFWQIIKMAVTETAGEIIIYKSEPAIAVFHAMSGSVTESAENVWGNPVPYLIAVPSEEANNIDDIRNFETESRFSAEEFKTILINGGFNLDFMESAGRWIENISVNSSGRVDYAVICGSKISGVQLRGLFALRSTDFTVETAQNGDFIFTVKGYGHGVGMSQYGANLMALEGSAYIDILKWYYTGIEIADADLFFE